MNGSGENQISLSISSGMGAIREALELFRDFWSSYAPGETCRVIELSVAEALNNIHKHAYGGRNNETIRVRTIADADWIEVTLEDHGEPPPQSVTEYSGTDTFDPQQLDLLPEGGFGLMLIHRQMDTVQFSRSNGRNKLVLRKSLCGD